VAIKPETAKAFMDAEAERGVSPKTWNDALKLLRATFKHLHPHLTDGMNPFHGLVTKATETVNREPFTVEELKAITEACAGDDFIRPVIVTGMCTAMRRGDCCLLKWEDVDLAAGFITVKTAKTGETVDIPVFPMLREELERETGCQIVRGNRRALKTDGLQAERENGKRRASVRDRHHIRPDSQKQQQPQCEVNQSRTSPNPEHAPICRTLRITDAASLASTLNSER
jgi:integrase